MRGIVLARLANMLDGPRRRARRRRRARGRGDARRRLAAADRAGAGQRRRRRDPPARPALLRPQRAARADREGAHGADQRLAVRGGARRRRRARARAARRARRAGVRALERRLRRARCPLLAQDLEPLWDDEHEIAALRNLRELRRRRRGRAPAPPGAGQLSHPAARPRRRRGARRRSRARAAEVSLRSVSDNPVYIPPDAERPLGTVLSTGGYHNAQAPAAIDTAATALADLCQLASVTPTSCSRTRPRRCS